MPHETLQDESTNGRRTSLLSFYLATLLSAIALSVVGSDQPLRKPLLSLAVAGAGAAVWFLLRFLRSNDERERQINYRALTFAFTGTLILPSLWAFCRVSVSIPFRGWVYPLLWSFCGALA